MVVLVHKGVLVRKGKKRAPGVLLSALLLGTYFPSLDASARASDQGCAVAPGSTLVVDVKDKGAKGDGLTDDTAAIQLAINEVAGTGGTVLVPDGVYMVNAAGKKRLRLKSDMTLKLTGATLKAIPNSSKYYSILSISGASNVAVVGGVLEGDREKHMGESGQRGMGIEIERGAQHILISGVTARNMWGDGFYVQGAEDVTFCSVTADYNRRQGLSIIAANGLVVTNSVFKNTRGTRPSSGIDLEPDSPSQEIINVRIQGSHFLDNAGAGLLIHGKKGPISNVVISDNVFKGNHRAVKHKYAPLVSAICNNRLIYQWDTWKSLPTFVDAIKFTVAQNECETDVAAAVRQPTSAR